MHLTEACLFTLQIIQLRCWTRNHLRSMKFVWTQRYPLLKRDLAALTAKDSASVLSLHIVPLHQSFNAWNVEWHEYLFITRCFFALHPLTFGVVRPVRLVTALQIPGNPLNIWRFRRDETMEGSHVEGFGQHKEHVGACVLKTPSRYLSNFTQVLSC